MRWRNSENPGRAIIVSSVSAWVAFSVSPMTAENESAS